MNEQLCGRIGRDPLSAIADKAAEIIMGRKRAWSVCLAPDGYVTVENPDQTIPEDVVGTWNQDLGRMELWRAVADELRDAAEERGIKGEPKYRTRVYAGRVSGRRAA